MRKIVIPLPSLKRRGLFRVLAAFILLVSLWAGSASAETEEEKRANYRSEKVFKNDLGIMLSEQQITKIAKDRLKQYEDGYIRDHLPLLAGTVWNGDITKKIDDLYGLLKAADAVTFMDNEPDRSDFEKVYPGYAGRKNVTDFAQARRDLVSRLQKYSLAALNENNNEASDIKDNLVNMLNGLDGATMSSSGYTQILQARNQIKIFVAQEVVNLRLDMLRQIEVRARLAAERQQRNTDRQAAFENAVEGANVTWRQQGGAIHAGY